MTDRKILVVSLGSIGRRHLRNAREMLPGARIAVYRQHTKDDGGVPEGADALLQDMDEARAFGADAVIVASPANTHVPVSLPFIEDSAHMFIEKPLADTAADIDELVKAAQASSSFIMAGYVLRFLPALGFIREMIDKGELGDIYTAHAQVGQYLPDWRPDSDYRTGVSAQKKLGGGALLELSHELDYSLWLFGDPLSLQCSAVKLSNLDIDVEDSAHVLLEYPDKRVCVQLDFLQRVAHMELQIVGSEATLRADLVKEIVQLYTPEHPDGKRLDAPALKEGNEIYLRQFDFFFSKCFDDYEPVFPETPGFGEWADIGQAAKVLQLVDKAREASETGSRQVFPGGAS